MNKNIILILILITPLPVFAIECGDNLTSNEKQLLWKARADDGGGAFGFNLDPIGGTTLENLKVGSGCNSRKSEESPNLMSEKLSAQNAISISFGDDNKTVSAKLSNASGNRIWGITATSPFDKDNPGAILGNLDGMAKKNKLSFFYTKIIDHSDSDVWNLDYDSDRKNEICTNYWSENPAARQTAVAKYLKAGGSLPIADPEICLIANIEDDPKLVTEFLNLLLDPSKIRYAAFGIEGSIAPKSYTYFNQDTLDKKINSSETDYSLSVFYRQTFGAIPNKSWTFGARYENNFNESGVQNICSLLAVGGTDQVCSDKRIGAPTETEKTVLFLDYGRRFMSNKGAMRLKVSRDLDNDITGVELPVWYVRDDKGALSGGVQFDWNDMEDDLGISVFIATPFELF
jgi:hypothetical protein